MITPLVTKCKDRRGRITGYDAHLGSLFVNASTAVEAKNRFDDAVRASLDRLAQGAYIGQWAGHTFVVSPDVNGWRYWLDTFTQTYTCAMPSTADRDTTINAALFHLAQNVWTSDVADDAAFVNVIPFRRPSDDRRNELRSWVKWQRRYARARSAGYDDHAARELANQGTDIVSREAVGQ